MIPKITEIGELKDNSFLVNYRGKVGIYEAAAQLAADYKKIFNQGVSVDPNVFLDDNLKEKGLTVKVTDGCPDEGRGCLLDFIDVFEPVETEGGHHVKVRQNQNWTDDNRFLEFHCELIDKYGF
ncbi:hypothetical protein KY312_04705 [Candidatus Woesearchaeota archaeon]|nr:hypothetical protein [Candidatus Woesearchaeota archaeon]